ncbi:MAG: putative protease [Candidatus Berkelbacteria bacterium Licking1014_96]|uniref:Putative protease n=1 Tax=Candidatus Berkelbacteria bacterium Licking1014_96 TaxID=2017149 RepID=A0A554LF16_9BACT|nr:MAG: putative protease [Candidatus Berkelbacteria bacterium Licking1014_96]
MKNKILVISTCDPEKTAILLSIYDYTSGITPRRCKKVWRARTHQSEELLPAIDKLLKKNKVKTEDLGLIVVNIGPGSFTGTRVGVATANALSFGLDIPVIGVKGREKEIEDILRVGFELFQKGKIEKGTLAKPFYNKAPNITIPKK